MKKILYLTNYPAPYRVKFFSMLGKECELTVLFEETVEEQSHRSEKWFLNSYDNFNAIFLKKIKVPKASISLEIFSWLKKEFDYIIIGVYSTLTAQLAIEYLKMQRKKFFIEIDGGYPKSGKGILEKLKKHLISSAKYWFSPSQLSDQYLLFYGADKEGIIRYPFSTLLKEDILMEVVSQQEKEEYKKKHGIREKNMVLTVGQFIYRKANDVLIESAQYFENDTGLYIVGGTAPREYIELVEKFNLQNIHFVDFKEKKELLEYYKAADVFALPTREDIWGLVINEAMSCGLPIVSTDKSIAALELINSGENGFIVPVEMAKEMAEKINYLLVNKDMCARMGKRSLELIQKYTIEDMVKIHMETFEKDI